MKKLLFSAALALGALMTTAVKAQLPFAVKLEQSAAEVVNANFSITSSQPQSFGATPTTYTISPAAVGYPYPFDVFTYGVYWVTPSLFTPLTVSIPAGGTVLIRNYRTDVTKYNVVVTVYTNAVPTGIQYIGTQVTVPYNQTGTLTIPASAGQYTGPIPFTGGTYGENIPIAIHLAVYGG